MEVWTGIGIWVTVAVILMVLLSYCQGRWDICAAQYPTDREWQFIMLMISCVLWPISIPLYCIICPPMLLMMWFNEVGKKHKTKAERTPALSDAEFYTSILPPIEGIKK